MRIHPVYKTAIKVLDSVESLEITAPDREGIFAIDIGDGMELGVMAGLANSGSDVLRVGFHAAKSRRDIRDHMFSPVGMARSSGDPYILFSDPTLTISDSSLLSWYLGTPNVNPDDWMERFVRKMLEITKAKYLLIEGSSGGGFTALRFAARFQFAVAVPKIPQTDLFRYMEGPLRKTLDAAGWTALSYETVMQQHSYRFRIADLYNAKGWNRGNIVQYVQNPGDIVHVNDHLTPFLAEVGSKSPNVFSAVRGHFAISRPFTGGGHVAIPREHWIAEASFGLKRLRKIHSQPKAESVWAKPPLMELPTNLSHIRQANIQAHLSGNTNW
ncbi:hypothetical protein ACTXJU_08865 [Glutamicibacter ardleyensis]|uniref:hypothetical protein n=1 Tax=Glutamicibacter ardleyensis TaxID=225894 RepID=UPI003FD1A169